MSLAVLWPYVPLQTWVLSLVALTIKQIHYVKCNNIQMSEIFPKSTDVHASQFLTITTQGSNFKVCHKTWVNWKQSWQSPGLPVKNHGPCRQEVTKKCCTLFIMPLLKQHIYRPENLQCQYTFQQNVDHQKLGRRTPPQICWSQYRIQTTAWRKKNE